MKAIILAGGKGTRLRPLTDIIPKPLLPIKGRPIIEHAICNLKKYGITDIILSIGYKADQIMEYFGNGNDLGVNLSYCVEKKLLGTGGAVKLAAKGIHETFIMLNGDNLCDVNYDDLLKVHSMNKAVLTFTLFPVKDVTKYGIAELDGQKVIRFIEKPSMDKAPSNLNNAGITVFEPEALDILPDGVSSIEYDCYQNICGKSGKAYAFIHKGQWFPTDDIEKYNKANNLFRKI